MTQPSTTRGATPDLFAADTLTMHEHLGFELGWDYAQHGLEPAAPYAQEPSPLRHGLLAGRASFGARTLAPTPAVQRWLQLRLHAWLRGRSVELHQVTPNYLAQIDAAFCPITRAALDAATASIDRVRNDAGYAAGNLVVMSAKANHAKGARGFREAQTIACELESGQARAGGIDGLNAAQWARAAVLCSFVEALPHDEASTLPLLVLPPNRLRLFNPAQALQAFVSRQLLQPGWSQRIARFEALLPGAPARRAFRLFFHALVPRVLEAGRGNTPHEARWAVEDAWRHPVVQRRWTVLARLLGAEACEALVAKASARRLGSAATLQFSPEQATDGWALESRGYVPHALLMRRGSARRAAVPVAESGARSKQAPLPLE